MNRYIVIRRLRWPALLLLTGVIALLDQADILSWGRAWPLYPILFGVLMLAERATLANEPPPPPAAYPYGYAAYPGYADPSAAPVPPPPAAPVSPSTSIVPAHGTAGDAALEPRKNWEEEGR